MGYQSQVYFSPINECLTSLNLYLTKPWHQKMHLGANWYEKTKQMLSPDFSGMLDKKKMGIYNPINLLCWFGSEKGVHTPEAFVSWIREQTIDDIEELLNPYVDLFPKTMETTVSKSIRMIEEWNHQYFSHLNKRILKDLKEIAEKHQQEPLSNSPKTYIEKKTNGLVFEETDQRDTVVLIPQYHCQPATIYYCFQGVTLVYYPANLPIPNSENQGSFTPSETAEQVLDILQESQEPVNFVQIMKRIGIDKVKMFDIASQLRAQGKVRMHVYTERSFALSIKE
jgi:aryl carrier-like protein